MTENHRDSRSDINARDVELMRRIAQTLDDSTAALDADTRAQLALARHKALLRTRRQRYIGAIALAASVLAIVSMPWMLRERPPERFGDDAAYLSVDPEMLADMDMLQAIGEVQ